MTTKPMLLEGVVAPDNWDVLRGEIEALRQKFEELDLVVGHIADELRSRIDRMENGLRIAVGEGQASQVSAGPRSDPKWDFWKQRFGGRLSETIDLLLNHREMNATQLCSALRCDPRTLAKSIIYPLNKSGLLNKNGGKFSLKDL